MKPALDQRFLVWVLAAFVGVVTCTGAAWADDIGKIKAEADDLRAQVQLLRKQYLGSKGFKSAHYAEERLIDGENFYRLKDYQRAAIIFMDIIESYPGHAAYPDALFYFADSLFMSRDFYGARQWFTRLLDETHKPGINRFKQKAVERLIEIAIHVDDFEGIETYFQQLGQSPDGQAKYIKGKYLYFRGDFDGAKREFAAVDGKVELELKAAYFTGVILTEQNRYDEAIEVFKSGSGMDVATSSEQEVVDLMSLGLGRLYYEKDFVENASVAYESVGRYSPYYDTALYEAASVQIRAGNTIAAERILEVLTLAIPDSKYIPRAKLLRGNLLLRTGRYDEAEKVFDETIGEFTPVREQLDELIADQKDTSRFFSTLLDRGLGSLDVEGALPPLVVKWVGEEPEVQRALALAGDLGVAREYTRETERLVRLLEAVIDGPSRINAIPTLRSGKRRGQQMSNRVGQLRGRLSRIVQKKIGSDANIQELAREREALQKELDSLPTSDEQFQRREEKARLVYQRMRQELARNIIRLDKLVAMVIALEIFSENPEYMEGATEESIKALKDELKRHRSGIEEMRQKVDSLKEDVERARYQVGVGDKLDLRDNEIRQQIKELTDKERAILRSRGGEFGKRIDRAYGALEQTDAELIKLHAAIDQEAERQIEELKRLVSSERQKVKQYRAELLVLGQEAEEVVGGVTHKNFTNVRKKFHQLILKADVGVIDVAWMRKEEHKARGTTLTKDRLSEIQNLDEEFKEVRTNEDSAGGGD